MFHLVVKEPFDRHKKGDEITDPAKVSKILAGPHEHHVIKRFAPDALVAVSSHPKPAPAAAPVTPALAPAPAPVPAPAPAVAPAKADAKE